MARGVVEARLGEGGAIAAVVQVVELGRHFEEVRLVAFEGLEFAAADVDADGSGVDADGEDDAVIVDIDEAIGVGVVEVGVKEGVDAHGVCSAIGGVVSEGAVVGVEGGLDLGAVTGGYGGDGDIAMGEVIEEDAIEEAGIDGIDKARGEDGEVVLVNRDGDASGVVMEGVGIEFGGGELGEEVLGGDG